MDTFGYWDTCNDISMLHDAPRLPVLCDDLVVPENRESGAFGVQLGWSLQKLRCRVFFRCILLVPKLDSNEATKISENMVWSMFDPFDFGMFKMSGCHQWPPGTTSLHRPLSRRGMSAWLLLRLLYLRLIYGILDCFYPQRCFPNHIWHPILALAPTPAQTHTLTKNKLGYSYRAILRMTP